MVLGDELDVGVGKAGPLGSSAAASVSVTLRICCRAYVWRCVLLPGRLLRPGAFILILTASFSILSVVFRSGPEPGARVLQPQALDEFLVFVLIVLAAFMNVRAQLLPGIGLFWAGAC